MAKKNAVGEEWVNRARTEAAKWEQLGLPFDKPRVTWLDAGAEELRDMVHSVVADGSAVLLARTSDGGALCLQVLNGEGRYKVYPASVAEIHEAVAAVTRIAQGH